MCGIIGLFTYKNDNIPVNNIVRSIIQRMLFTESMVNMESRGKDASGIAVLWSDGEVGVLKQPIHSSMFARDDGGWGEEYTNPDDKKANFKEMMKLWLRNKNGAYIKQVLGHVRAKTQGSEFNPHNNHPIIITNEPLGKGGSLGSGKNLLVGVHNGGIKNDNELFKKYAFSRIGEVDSEIIFHLINRFRDNFSTDNLKDVFDELSGAFAVMAFNPSNTNKVACLREERPMEAVFIPELGILGIISVKDYLFSAIIAYDRWRVREYYSSITVPTDSGEITVKVSDFPTISQIWANTVVSSGVFVLDLDTEVNDKTKPEDLIKIKSMFKPATSSSYGGYASGKYEWKDNRAANTDSKAVSTPTPATPAIPLPPAKPEVPKDTIKNNETVVEDFTDYSTKEPEDDSVNPYIDVEVKVENESQPAKASDIQEEDSSSEEEDNLSNEDSLVADTGFGWDDLVKMGLARLYEGDLDANNILTIHKKKKSGARDLLSDYLINFNSEEEAYTALVSMTEVIFPEGFAVGFAEGYNTAVIERNDDLISEDDEDSEVAHNEALTAVHKKLSDIEAELDVKEGQLKEKDNKISELNKNIITLQAKQEKYSRRLSNQYTMIKYLMYKLGIMDGEGNIDKSTLDQIRKEAVEHTYKKV